MIKLSNISNIAAWGTEWVNGDNGNRYQMVQQRGTSGLVFGVLPAGQNRWINTPVSAPERFGHVKVFKSYREFEAIVRAYVEA